MNIIHIGDIHFGSIDPNTLYNELKEIFIKYILSHIDEIDMIVICGDLIDKKLQFNSDNTKLLLTFMDELLLICKENKIYLRLIQGTYTHDGNQLKNFEFMEDKNIFKIIYTVEEEYFAKFDEVVLYIPEEYPENWKIFYADYISKIYDYIFVHGTFKFIAHKSQIITSEKNISTAPVFDEKLFNSICKNIIFASHIHVGTSYGNIYYPGSFSRDSFGEEESKGFIHYKEDKIFKINNKLAQTYKTFDLSEYNVSSQEDLLTFIYACKKKFNHVRFINTPDGLSIDILRSIAKNNPEIKVLQKSNVNQDKDEFDLVISRNLSLDLELQEYLKIKKSTHVDINIINDILDPTKEF